MNDLSKNIGEYIYVKLIGEKRFKGLLIDVGNDIVVIYDGKDYIYISLYHIQYYKFMESLKAEIQKPETDSVIKRESPSISLRKVLSTSKGIFTEVYVTGSYSLHGYVTSIMNDYIVFYSPVYKTVYISLKHLKWLIPYQENQTPYALNKNELSVNPLNITLARTFEEQLIKMAGKIMVFDLGEFSNKIGKMTKIEDSHIELIKARDEKVYLNIQHVKSVHFP
ncbi:MULTISPECIES: hypothetical protein [Bacillus cereus group]|uniref:hypothetical protein n=1 Tax=Bacillus cereus group TaxID=86661 RepID=UPI0001A09E84|nr:MULTISPECIES: hypothetical protein [Bacillus cereus group]EEL52320.1 hypothetical protein bcere0022_3110 [Bacillus cereus Rock3-44]PFA17441.1 DUF2642 domain-containing protein [Bacillus cereus]PFO82389.1 DUF2642 domain-containing protein [Bacillus cereus]PFR27263.1 DUF2642 domain-containing protein [Bacillus cereus]PGZ13046.1 DUF2642 domain-containing protein [Bacillus cereus]